MLQDELPAVKDLWNEANGVFWPKDEQVLSTYVARHLRDDLSSLGIIVNREVQIRPGTGNRTGQLTDLHVDATIPGGMENAYERVSVVIETKGNWHPELSTAMQTQLRDRYLKDNSSKNGIYLIGWYSCDAWNKQDDSRKERCPKMTLEEAREEFQSQGIALSKDGYLIRARVLDLSLV